MGNLMAQDSGQFRFVLHVLDDAGVDVHVTAGHGKGIDDVLVDERELEGIPRLLAGRNRLHDGIGQTGDIILEGQLSGSVGVVYGEFHLATVGVAQLRIEFRAQFHLILLRNKEGPSAVEEIALTLSTNGVRALPYHAGLDAQVRVGGDEGAGEVIACRLHGELSHHAGSVAIPLLLPANGIIVCLLCLVIAECAVYLRPGWNSFGFSNAAPLREVLFRRFGVLWMGRDALAAALHLTLNTRYTREDIKALAKAIRKDKTLDGKTIVICWEHKVIPEIVAALGWLFDTMDQQLFNLARVPAMQELLGKDGSPASPDAVNQFGPWATSIFLMGWATGGLLFGVLGDRFGRAKVMMWTILVYSVFTGISAFSTSFWDFALWRFLTGLGVGGEFAVGVALVAEVMPERARPFALGLLQAL